MEKISFYDLLSLLLPGSLCSLFILIVANDFGINWNILLLNESYQLIVFLSSAFILGSSIDIVTRKSLKYYGMIGLYNPIYKIYTKLAKGTPLEPFYKDLKQFTGDEKEDNEKMEVLWSEIFYDLEAKDRINVPKTYQSFYFFYRNFITLSIPIVLVSLFMMTKFPDKYTCIFVISIIVMLLSFFNARWNRIKMVDRTFWIYYSLNKNR